MAIIQNINGIWATLTGVSVVGAPKQYICDIDSEIPVGEEADLAYSKESHKMFIRKNLAWVELGGGTGSLTATVVEVNLGTTPKSSGKFTITDAEIGQTSKIHIQQAPGPYTGKGTQGDEAAMDPLWCVAIPASGSAVVYWRTMGGVSVAPIQGGSSGRTNISAPSQDDPQARFKARVVGFVKGNVKFLYSIAS